VKGRTVSFYIDPGMIDDVLSAFDHEVLPRYRAMPHFLGLVILQSESGERREVLGLSVWDGSRHDADAVIEQFLGRIAELGCTSASRKSYDVLRLVQAGLSSEP
jgi:hypothetical protein